MSTKATNPDRRALGAGGLPTVLLALVIGASGLPESALAQQAPPAEELDPQTPSQALLRTTTVLEQRLERLENQLGSDGLLGLAQELAGLREALRELRDQAEKIDYALGRLRNQQRLAYKHLDDRMRRIEVARTALIDEENLVLPEPWGEALSADLLDLEQVAIADTVRLTREETSPEQGALQGAMEEQLATGPPPPGPPSSHVETGEGNVADNPAIQPLPPLPRAPSPATPTTAANPEGPNQSAAAQSVVAQSVVARLAPIAKNEETTGRPPLNQPPGQLPPGQLPPALPGERLLEATPPPPEPQPDPIMAKADYDKAFSLLRRGHYQQAVRSFQEYLHHHPGDDQVANAEYWVGEAYYVMRNYQEAIRHIGAFLARYPRNKKSSQALYKLARSHLLLGDRQSAQRLFQNVLRRFPGSPAANLAKRELESMEKIKTPATSQNLGGGAPSL